MPDLMVRPTDAEMVALGEDLAEAARAVLANDHDCHARVWLRTAAAAWDGAMIDRFMSAIEGGQ
jgi:hypothetical protein